MLLSTLTGYLDDLLQIKEFSGDASLNGLQVEGARRVQKISLAVDGCRVSIRKAARRRSDILIVHHGLFWGEREPITGILRERIEILLKNRISLYAAHLPLDAHPEIGNNAQLAKLLKMKECERFGEYSGREIGVAGKLPRALSAGGLAGRIEKALSTSVEIFDFGRSPVRKLAVVSGDGASLVEEAAKRGCDALLTGEKSHSAYHTALELGISILCAGHYATETTGIKALGKILKKEFGLESVFLDIPTGV